MLHAQRAGLGAGTQTQRSAPRSRPLCTPPARASSSGTAVSLPKAKAKKQPGFPFTRIAGQEEMKLALLLNVVDPNIGGALVMGDRGCGKSVAVSVGEERGRAGGRAARGRAILGLCRIRELVL